MNAPSCRATVERRFICDYVRRGVVKQGALDPVDLAIEASAYVCKKNRRTSAWIEV